MSRKSLVPIQLPADPTLAMEAATKQYVDGKLSAVPSEVEINTADPIGSNPAAELWYDTDAVPTDAAPHPYWHGGYVGSLTVNNAAVTTIPIVVANKSTHTWTLAGGIITVPTAGFYILTAACSFTAPPWSVIGTPKRAFVQVSVSGASRNGRSTFGPLEDTASCAWSCWMTAGSLQAQFSIFQDSGSAKTMNWCEVGICCVESG